MAATGTLAATESYGLLFGADPYVEDGGDSAPSSRGPGRSPTVEVAIGDTVAKGDVLATADTAALQRDLDERHGRPPLREYQSRHREGEPRRRRGRWRRRRGAPSPARAVQRPERGLAGVRSPRRDPAQIKDAALKAPIAGIVTAVNIRAGFDAPSGPAIVVASTTYQVTTDVVESDLADIKVGQTASVTIDALDIEVEGTVSAISPVAGDGSSGVVAFPVTVTLTERTRPRPAPA